MKKTRKLLAILLIACLIASFAPAAFADDAEAAAAEADVVIEIVDNGDGTVTGTRTVAGEQKPTVTIEGSIADASVNASDGTVQGGVDIGESGIGVHQTEGTSMSISITGDVSASANDTGAYVSAQTSIEKDATATVTIDGNVTAEGLGVYVSSQSNSEKGATTTATLITTGDVTGEDYSGIVARSGATSKGVSNLDINIGGSVEGEHNGIYVDSYTHDSGSAEATVTVDGGVTSKDDGIYIDSSAKDEGSSKTTVKVGEDVTVKNDDGYAQGIIISSRTYPMSSSDEQAEDKATNTVSVTVDGGVSVEGKYIATGVAVGEQHYDYVNPFNGTATVIVKEDVEVKGDNQVIGVEAMASGDNTEVTLNVGGVTAKAQGEEGRAVGVQLNAYDGSTVNAIIGEEGITTTGGADDIYSNVGAVLQVADESNVSLTVAGDVKAEGVGIALSAGADPEEEESNPGNIDVFVEGSVSGEKGSFLLASPSLNSSNVSLTVWKADIDEAGNVVALIGSEELTKEKEHLNKELENATNEGNEGYIKYLNSGLASIEEYENNAAAIAAEIEKNILYIVKVGEDGKSYKGLNLTNTTEVNGVYAATETTTVTVKALSGYKIISVSGQNDETAQILAKDKNGNYYIVIPKGGGMWLNVKLEKIESSGTDYAPVYALGSVTAKDGSVLTLFNDKSYTLVYADGVRERGSWNFAGDQLVFTNPDKAEIAPEVDGDGNATYTFKEGTEFVFTSTMLAAVRSFGRF